MNADTVASALFTLSALVMGIGAFMKSRSGQDAAAETSLTCLFLCIAVLLMPEDKTTNPKVEDTAAVHSTARS